MKDQIHVNTAIHNKRCNVTSHKIDLMFTEAAILHYQVSFTLYLSPGHGRHYSFYLHRGQLELQTIKRVEGPVSCQAHQVEREDLELCEDFSHVHSGGLTPLLLITRSSPFTHQIITIAKISNYDYDITPHKN